MGYGEPMTKASFGLLVVMVCASLGCEPLKKVNQPCTKSTSLGSQAGDCASGLICSVNDACTGQCPGTCRMECKVDSDCPTDCTCTGRFSPENGNGKRCAGTPCPG